MDKAKLLSLLVPPSVTIKAGMKKLDETAEKILFVVNENHKLCGTVTDGDIRRGLINGLRFEDKIEKVMCQKFMAVHLDDENIEERAKELMLKNKFEQIPVIDSNGIIKDVILWTDIFGTLVRQEYYATKPNKVVIMAGGKGTRLDPFTRILPKPLIPIGDRPVIEVIMDTFSRYGFNKFVYTLNYKKEYIKLYLQENKFSYEIEWVEEPDFLGTVGSLSLLEDKLRETFYVVNCDSLLNYDYEKILLWHKKSQAALTIVGCHNEIKIPFGVLELSNGDLVSIREKPTHDVIINTGIYIIEPKVISNIPKGRKIDMNEFIDIILKRGEKVTVYPISSGWFDIGQWEEYKKCVNMLLDRDLL